ncbi:unnamed protein product, partial [Adineta steineri]
MTSITVYLIFLTLVLSNIIKASYIGDGCCEQWAVDGSCCLDYYSQCCDGGGVGYYDGGRNAWGR